MQEREKSSEAMAQSYDDQPISYGLCRLFLVFMLGAGQTTLLISLPAMMEETGIGYVLLSGMVAFGTGLFILSAPVWGKLSDHFGRKPVVVAGVVGIALSFSLITLSVLALNQNIINRQQAILLMFVARGIYGLLASGLYPAVQAWAMDEEPDNASRSLSRITASINGGRLVGPLIPALLIGWGSEFPMAFIAVLTMLLFLWVIFLPLRNTVEPAPSKSEERSSIRLLSVTWPYLLLACSVTTLFGFLQYVIGPMLLSVFQNGAETSRMLSWLMMLAALSTIVAHFLFSRWVQGQVSLALKIGTSWLLIGTLMMLLGDGFAWLAAGLVISAASVTLLTPSYTTIASKQLKHQQGLLTGMLSMIHTTGYTVGALLAGFTAGHDSWLMAAIGIAVAAVALVTAFLCVEVNVEVKSV
ncbi:MFS transporter [Endozoicomonas ascidiicola]|uniref:MFS transporter n=1 Tax=Endozoicomonas ascidiicola TaxID=1698521 RepID=UPI000833B7AE|nr:MFS transporter [Endozoicomonas ascidiicola]